MRIYVIKITNCVFCIKITQKYLSLESQKSSMAITTEKYEIRWKFKLIIKLFLKKLNFI